MTAPNTSTQMDLWQVLYPVMDAAMLESLEETDRVDDLDADRREEVAATLERLAHWILPPEEEPTRGKMASDIDYAIAWALWHDHCQVRSRILDEAGVIRKGTANKGS